VQVKLKLKLPLSCHFKSTHVSLRRQELWTSRRPSSKLSTCLANLNNQLNHDRVEPRLASRPIIIDEISGIDDIREEPDYRRRSWWHSRFGCMDVVLPPKEVPERHIVTFLVGGYKVVAAYDGTDGRVINRWHTTPALPRPHSFCSMGFGKCHYVVRDLHRGGT
jgi:hypothetical protein